MRNAVLFLAVLAAPAIAQQPVQGPDFTGQALAVTGRVLAVGAPQDGTPCVQLRVDRSQAFSGGRLWVCDPTVTGLALNQQVSVDGVASGTRRTKMGGAWRTVPVVRAAPTVL